MIKSSSLAVQTNQSRQILMHETSSFSFGFRTLVFLFTGLSMLCGIPSEGWSHGEAVLCDNREDLIIQCGDFHECITNEDVSEFIGYCKAMAEEIMFTLCDRRLEGMGCEVGEVCKIGTIDPHIGVCMPIPNFNPPVQGGMSEEEEMMTGGDMMMGGDQESDSSMNEDLTPSSLREEEGCQSTVMSPLPLLIWIMIILGMFRIIKVRLKPNQAFWLGLFDP